ncbi:MAG: hypothetical protein JSV09_03950 [Thermoplasmata archaeon]|nr:MAG: hypothetical protein JSV09_03950 [Thermoplasmata archaeon]
MKKEIERLIPLWDLISEGSVECQLSQENEMIGVHITSNTITIDFKDDSAIELISPFVKKNLESKKHTREYIQERGSVVLGLMGALGAKREELGRSMSFAQEIATVLAKNGKCLIIKEKGRQLAKLGAGANSLRMRMMNLEHVEVNDLSALLRLLSKLRAGRGNV